MGTTFGAGVVLCARTFPKYPSPMMVITIAVTGKAITRSARKCFFSALIRVFSFNSWTGLFTVALVIIEASAWLMLSIPEVLRETSFAK